MAKKKNKNSHKKSKIAFLCNNIGSYQIITSSANEVRMMKFAPSDDTPKLCDYGFFQAFFSKQEVNEMFCRLVNKVNLNSILNADLTKTGIALHELPKCNDKGEKIISGLHYNCLSFLSKIIISVPLYKSDKDVNLLEIQLKNKKRKIRIPIYKHIVNLFLPLFYFNNTNRHSNDIKINDLKEKFTFLFILIIGVVFSGFIVRYLRYINEDFRTRYVKTFNDYKIAQEELKAENLKTLSDVGFGFF